MSHLLVELMSVLVFVPVPVSVSAGSSPVAMEISSLLLA